MSAQIIFEDLTMGSGDGSSTETHRLALNAIFTAAYKGLRRLASTIRRGDPQATLNPTVLANEAWFKLADYPVLGMQSKLDFKRIAARAMRQLLVESARRRHTGKRGSGAIFVTFDESLECTTACAQDLLVLDAALDELAKVNLRQATIPDTPVPAPSPQPQRFHGSVLLVARRAGRDAVRVADEVISHLAGLVGANVSVILEVEAEVEDGVPEKVARTVTENCRTLKFENQGFEES